MNPQRESSMAGERIAKMMARAGRRSRREAEAWIAQGRVAVNGKVITSPALNVTARDRITRRRRAAAGPERTRLFLYHKPAGLVTTHADPAGRPTLFAALPAGLPRLVSVGRLDLNTEGLLLLTNDGGLARVLELPATGWLRRYRVRAHGRVQQAALDRLRSGITIDGVRYGSIEATLDREQGSNVWLTFAMREGKNREVKNVLGHLGLAVNRLIRVSYGPFQLTGLAEGADRGGQDAGAARATGRANRGAVGRGFLRRRSARSRFRPGVSLTVNPRPRAARTPRRRGGTRRRRLGEAARPKPHGRSTSDDAEKPPGRPSPSADAGDGASPNASASRNWRVARSGTAASGLPAPRPAPGEVWPAPRPPPGKRR